ncbi:MAG: UDP-N-acetylglucosamine 2-epimerase (non-hydrolyzing) [Candidatus Eisenbacteria sp.]|nr:UDP-N-acetylglucosamine 2-epimerase (non-hydrolyzing) [Candidatus Eisenbacteria bacterium]
MLVHCIVGTRPNFVKIAPIMKALGRCQRIRAHLIHTGQHYDTVMSRSFFEDLTIPEPDRYLNVGSGTHAVQTARIMESYEQVLNEEKPGLVLVVGDVNSTLACSLTAAKAVTPIAHIEAGLRSFDRTMPEEINRLVTDTLADHLFTTCTDADENLRREGVSPERIHFVGNVMIDALLTSLPLAARKKTIKRLQLEAEHYALVTIHRPSNVDEPESFFRVLMILEAIGRMLPVVFPIHPRTEKQAEALGLADRLHACPGLQLVAPLRYLEFINLLSSARLVLTDSGGIQEETTILRIPCLTLRPNTERPITIREGTNRLVGTDPDVVIDAARKALGSSDKPKCSPPPLWDGKAAERIAAIVEQIATAPA